MAASDHLSPYQFEEIPGSMFSSVLAKHDGKNIGNLMWRTSSYEIKSKPEDQGRVFDVSVDSDHQRKGVASEMWRKAKQIDPGIHHSSNQTSAGKAWAKKVGD